MSRPPALNRVNGAMLMPNRSGNGGTGGTSQSILSTLLVSNSRASSGLIHSGLSTTVYPAASQLGAAAASFQQQQQQMSNHQQHFHNQLQPQNQQFNLNHHSGYGGVSSSIHSRMPFQDLIPSVSSSSHQSFSMQQTHHQSHLLIPPPVSNPITVLQPKPRLPLVVQQHHHLQQQLPSLSVIPSGGSAGSGFRPPPLPIDDAGQQTQSTPPPPLCLASLTPPQTVDNSVQCGPSLKADAAVSASPAPVEDSNDRKPAGMVAFRLSLSRRRNIAESIVEFERSKASGNADGVVSGRIEKTKTSSACASSSSLPASTSLKKRKNLTNSLLVRAGAELHLESHRAIRLVHGCLQQRIRNDIDNLLAGYFDSYVQPCLSNIRTCECMDEELADYEQHHRATFYRTVAEDLVAQFAANSESVAIAGQQLLQRPQQRADSLSGGGGSSPFSAYRHEGEAQSVSAVVNLERTVIGPDTSFVVGSCVNRCLGLVSRGCQRVYERHRHLYRYLCDAEDKRFLVDRAYLNSSSGARTYLLVLDEVLQLLELPEYRAVSQRSIERLKSSAFLLPIWFARKVLPIANASAAASASGAASENAAAASPANSSLVGGLSEPVSPCSVTGVSSLSAPSSP